MRDKYLKAIAHFGERGQVEKTLEELKELRLELRRELNGNGDRQAIISEMADVLNMLNQIRIIYQVSEMELCSEMDRKMDRTIVRIRKEKQNVAD